MSVTTEDIRKILDAFDAGKVVQYCIPGSRFESDLQWSEFPYGCDQLDFATYDYRAKPDEVQS